MEINDDKLEWICPNCGAWHVSHTVCPECGYYRGQIAIEKEAAV